MRLPSLFAPVAALLVSCGPEAPPSPTSLVPSNYDGRFTEVRNCRNTTEHAMIVDGRSVTNIRVVINPEAAAAYRMNAAQLPVGTLVIKEEFSDPSCSRLLTWTVMRKEPAGYDPMRGDWRWQRVRASDRAVLEDGRVSRCSGCHDRPECTMRDWQCTDP